MAIKIDNKLTPQKLLPAIERMFELSAQKILNIEKTWKPAAGTPVFTAKGRYTSRGWTEWTQGFQFGSAVLQFDATDDARFLELGRRKTFEEFERIAPIEDRAAYLGHFFLFRRKSLLKVGGVDEAVGNVGAVAAKCAADNRDGLEIRLHPQSPCQARFVSST